MEKKTFHCQLCKKKNAETWWRMKGLIMCKQCYDKLHKKASLVEKYGEDDPNKSKTQWVIKAKT